LSFDIVSSFGSFDLAQDRFRASNLPFFAGARCAFAPDIPSFGCGFAALGGDVMDMMDRSLSEEQRLMRRSCRAFVNDFVIPFIRANWQRE
jgi:hypothetical protein